MVTPSTLLVPTYSFVHFDAFRMVFYAAANLCESGLLSEQTLCSVLSRRRMWQSRWIDMIQDWKGGFYLLSSEPCRNGVLNFVETAFWQGFQIIGLIWFAFQFLFLTCR